MQVFVKHCTFMLHAAPVAFLVPRFTQAPPLQAWDAPQRSMRPMGKSAQVPSCPGTTHDLQELVHSVWQQTPSTQCPFRQSWFVTHSKPSTNKQRRCPSHCLSPAAEHGVPHGVASPSSCEPHTSSVHGLPSSTGRSSESSSSTNVPSALHFGRLQSPSTVSVGVATFVTMHSPSVHAYDLQGVDDPQSLSNSQPMQYPSASHRGPSVTPHGWPAGCRS